MTILKIAIGITLLLSGIISLYLPFITFVFGLSSFSTWDYVSVNEKVLGVLMLIIFTVFAAIPSFLFTYGALWLLGNNVVRRRLNPTLFRFRK